MATKRNNYPRAASVPLNEHMPSRNRLVTVTGRRRPVLQLQRDEQDARILGAGPVPGGSGGHGDA